MSDTQTAAGAADETGAGYGLRLSLGVRDLVVQGLLFIAPMAPVGIFGTAARRVAGAASARRAG